MSSELETLKIKYESLAKDHEDDWKRIQDAERALDAERAKSAKLRAALETILHKGNMAMQGKWDDTAAMKDIAYAALMSESDKES